MNEGAVLTQAGRAAAEASLGVATGKRLQAAGHFEASLTHQFLPRCRQCGHKHPLAYVPPLERETCPSCFAAVAAPAPPVEVPAALVCDIPIPRRARILLALGRFFRRYGHKGRGETR